MTWMQWLRPKAKDEKTLLDFLRTIPLFQELSPRDLWTVEQQVYVRGYQDGEAIFHEGDPSYGMHIVKSGAVKVLRQVPDDRPLLLSTLLPGDFLGEMGLIDESPRTATAVAQGPTETIAFFKPELMKLTQQNPDLGLKILFTVARTLSARLRKVDHHLQEISRSGRPIEERMTHT
jgi:CRP-like cAMP-binding protein